MSPTNTESDRPLLEQSSSEIPLVPHLHRHDSGSLKHRTNSHRADAINNNGKVVSERTKDTSGFDLAKYEAMEFHPQVRWPDMIVQISLHLVSLYGFYRILTLKVKLFTVLFAAVTTYTSGFGITAGAHRLWSHRAYKARLPMRVLLAFLFSITGQRDLYTWALDHRVHHKYSDSVADPHDARRGFWFAHVGWLVLTPHPAVEDRRRELTALSQDLLQDRVVYWQRIFNVPLFALLNITLPVWIPMYMWHESLLNAFIVSFVTRFTVTLNIAFCVNSVAHFFGNKPYDKNIKPVENQMVSVFAMGEGWHNYHHTFPWDYKTSEFGKINPSTRFIDFCAKLGWAYDRKFATSEMVELRSKRSGDGSRQHGHSHTSSLWGYGDKDMLPQEQKLIQTAQTHKPEKI